MKTVYKYIRDFILYYIFGVIVLGLFDWITLLLDETSRIVALLTAVIVIVYEIVRDRREKKEESEYSVTQSLELANNKEQFMELNRNNKDLVERVRPMSDDEFKEFIHPYYVIFHANTDR